MASLTTLQKLSIVTASAMFVAMGAVSSAQAFTLSNGPGDGTLTIGVDGYGSFGSAVGSTTSNAYYDPIGSGTGAGTSFESGVAIRFGNSGQRKFLTSGSIGGSGYLGNPTVTGTNTSANSSFNYGGLLFNLNQILTPTYTNGVQTGSTLTQTYNITNTANTSLSFELLRYLDGDLYFDGSLIDGGGRLVANGREILFETDSATGSNTSTTFVGISADGGTIPVVSRYEIDSFSGLRSRIIAGTALDSTIRGDGLDADEFIDAGNGYDVTLALNNLFSLSAGGSTTYTTRTYFGAGTPQSVADVPEPASTLGLLALGTIGAGSMLKRKQQKKATLKA
ncbi:MAG TPA: PEP-CTERM sorting domain-containing protein [Leptolyngbyaceae cyanobacterium]